MNDTQKHTFTVTIHGCSVEDAEQVMSERLGYDEDYGFDYRFGAVELTTTDN